MLNFGGWVENLLQILAILDKKTQKHQVPWAVAHQHPAWRSILMEKSTSNSSVRRVKKVWTLPYMGLVIFGPMKWIDSNADAAFTGRSIHFDQALSGYCRHWEVSYYLVWCGWIIERKGVNMSKPTVSPPKKIGIINVRNKGRQKEKLHFGFSAKKKTPGLWVSCSHLHQAIRCNEPSGWDSWMHSFWIHPWRFIWNLYNQGGLEDHFPF